MAIKYVVLLSHLLHCLSALSVCLSLSFSLSLSVSRHRNEKRNRAASTDSNSKGLPQFFGTYYAMGKKVFY